ncbi:DUF4209 domain-containing protein [Avibacterium avium]|uniref:DUF4209 domain-containing protein n=1 Tax=Avibacterium avium TaxID=751 RepID=UPI003BF8FD17
MSKLSDDHIKELAVQINRLINDSDCYFSEDFLNQYKELKEKFKNKHKFIGLDDLFLILERLLSLDSIKKVEATKDTEDPFYFYNMADKIKQNEIKEWLMLIAEILESSMLKAKIYDALWVYVCKDKIFSEKAIENYLSLDDDNCFVYQYWHRGIFLAKTMKNNAFIEMGVKKLKKELAKESNYKFHKLKIAEIFVKTKIDQEYLSQIAEVLFKEATNFSTVENFNEREQYLVFLIELYTKLDKNFISKLNECKCLLAKTYEESGDVRISNSIFAAVIFYKKAKKVYVSIPKKYRNKNHEDILKNLEEKIVEAQTLIQNELKEVSTGKIDISLLIEKSINHVKGKGNLPRALCYFSGISKSDVYHLAIKNAELSMKNSIMQHIATQHIINQNDGRTTGKIPVLNESNQDEVLIKRAIKLFLDYMQLSTQGSIIPALESIRNEYGEVPKNLLIEMCQASAIVPNNRIKSVAKALYFGFNNEFSTSIYLLAPQVENMVRQYLNKNNIQTRHIDDKTGTDDEKGLSSLLDLNGAREALGDDLWFELKAVFADPIGVNLRNDIAHGLIDDDSGKDGYFIYAWWMIFRWIIRNINCSPR